jgi:hypothetical protein
MPHFSAAFSHKHLLSCHRAGTYEQVVRVSGTQQHLTWPGTVKSKRHFGVWPEQPWFAHWYGLCGDPFPNNSHWVEPAALAVFTATTQIATAKHTIAKKRLTRASIAAPFHQFFGGSPSET